MAELVDAPDSKSGAFGRPGSTPGLGTTSIFFLWKPSVDLVEQPHPFMENSHDSNRGCRKSSNALTAASSPAKAV